MFIETLQKERASPHMHQGWSSSFLQTLIPLLLYIIYHPDMSKT